jgi:hypothetical protein
MNIFRTLALMILLLNLSSPLHAQFGDSDDLPIDEGDLNVGGDIFSDFNEDLDSTQIAEDERFYRYGRYFSFNIGLGMTTFDGNRGNAYDNQHPSYNVFFNAFMNFQNSFTLGFGYSKHFLDAPLPTVGHKDEPARSVQINMLRVFFGYRYYLDTTNLGTALTYSNPYSTFRLEYWYQTNKYDPDINEPNKQGGGLGFAIGGGLEFPVRLRESYINVEALIHSVNFFDKDTREWQSLSDGTSQGFGYDDLKGNVYSIFINYVIHW